MVTANKALLAEHGPELFELAASKNLGLYYEASVAGGIPIIQTLKESLAGNRIKALTGILNGTANFIMSEMTDKGENSATVLAKARPRAMLRPIRPWTWKASTRPTSWSSSSVWPTARIFP